jgi:hypothetical protein
MAASPLAEFELVLPTQSANRGLMRRLMDQTLRPPERQYLELVERIASLEDEGHAFPAIAEQIGWELQKLRQTTLTEKYRLVRKYVADRALLQTDGHAIDRRRAERRRWDAYGGKVLDYYDQALRRHLSDDPDATGGKRPRWKKGDYVDMDRAERVAKLYAESAGWLEPPTAQAKPKELKVGVIQQVMQAYGAADRRETVVRVTTTETIEVGSRETAGMGGEG